MLSVTKRYTGHSTTKWQWQLIYVTKSYVNHEDENKNGK